MINLALIRRFNGRCAACTLPEYGVIIEIQAGERRLQLCLPHAMALSSLIEQAMEAIVELPNDPL